MAIFDIMSDVAKKEIEKSDNGDSRLLGLMVGKVVKNYDKNMPGRVCVMLLTREKAESENQNQNQGGDNDNYDSRELWARVVMPSSGGDWGHYFIPEVGDQVVLAFEHGIIERPYVIGCIPKAKDKILTGSIDEKNRFKKIVTKNGSMIYFEDTVKAGEGEEGGGGGAGGGGDDKNKDKIIIQTAEKAHRIEFDNDKETILISDKEGKNYIKMVTTKEKGSISVMAEKNITVEAGENITLKAGKKVTIEVGDNIKLTMNDSSGTTELTTKKFKASASESLKMESSSKADFTGGNVSVEGSSMVKVKSSGAVQVSGTPIKLG